MAALTFVSGGIFGETTKALRQSWNQRVVETDQDILVDEINIRQLFNDLKLFPSKSQGCNTFQTIFLHVWHTQGRF